MREDSEAPYLSQAAAAYPNQMNIILTDALIKAARQRKPVVFRNQMIQGTYQLRALSIRMEVLALEDGAPGDFIRVRNKRSSKELRGLVIDPSTVRIQ